MINSIKKYIEKCELFENIKEINVDYQDDQTDNFSINTIPENRLINEDVTGIRYMQISFNLMSRVYTATDLDRIENLHFLDDLAEWIYEQNEANNLPELPKENQVATSIEVTNNGYLYSNNPDIQNGIYQMQLKLYYKELVKEEK